MDTLGPFTNWLQKHDHAPYTIRAYLVAMRDFCAWFQETTREELTPERITPLDVRQYRQHLTTVRRLKASTINNYLAGVRAYAQWAKQTRRAHHDPTEGIKSLRIAPQTPHWLTRSEQYALVRGAREDVQLGDLRAKGNPAHLGAIWPRRDLALVLLFLNTGLRLSEVADLHTNDVDIRDRSGLLQVGSGKGRKARTVPLNKGARNALEAWLKARQGLSTQDPCLFLSQKGGRLTPRAIGFRIRTLAKKAHLNDVSPHTLRHSFAKNLVDAGVGLEKVATLLGHESLDTTRLYTIPSKADLQEATERVTWEA